MMNIPKLLLAIGLPFLSLPATAQTFTIEGGSGPSVNFNQVGSPTGLPPKVKVIRYVGVSFSVGIRYQQQHSLTALAVNTASLKRGFRTDNLTLERNSSGQVVGMDNSAAFLGDAPVHFTLGSGYTTIIHDNLRITALGGVGYMLVVDKFSPPLANSYTRSTTAPIPEERIEFLLNESLVRHGNFGVWGETGASVQLTTRSALGATLRYYHGLKTITKLDSEFFRYTNTRENYQANYDVQLLNKGRYASLRLSYYYTL